MAAPTAEQIAAMAQAVGILVDAQVCQRAVKTIGPALDGFAPVSGTLTMDVEPSHFVRAQIAATKG